MKTKDFMYRCARGLESSTPRNGEKKVSRLMWDGKTVYSFGKHYPLLFKLGDNWICNDAGYSRTTWKHIGQARMYSTWNVELPRHSSDVSANGIINAAKEEILRNEAQIQEGANRQLKRPRHAEVYQRRIDELDARNRQLARLVTEAMQFIPA